MSRFALSVIMAVLIESVVRPSSGLAQAAIGNRANGFSYQPTPEEVVPREKALGVRPSPAQQSATDEELERIDRDLLRKEGVSPGSVPDIKPR
jgi:hypothetical protein